MKFTNEILRKIAPMAAMPLVGLLCSFAALAAPIDTNACAAGTGGPTPTNTVFPVDCTGDLAGTLEAAMSVPFTYTTTAGTNDGFIYSAVYDDNGTLDFYYQVTNAANSATALARLTATNFGGFITNSAYRTDGATLGTYFVNGTNAPVTSDSNANGSVIGFSFYPPSGPPAEIAPGQESYVLIISTNATMWTAGNASIIDGGTDTVAAFQPASVPEPATLSLLGFGLLGLAGLGRRLRR